jgi:deoxyguanosine kinase
MHIAIEGNIGAGKTTLARLLAKRLDGLLLLEDFESNPFLELFYEDPGRHAFPLEVSFMAQRFIQWNSSSQGELFHSHIISDYHYVKSLLFASKNLDQTVLPSFEKLFRLLSKDLQPPDLIIYLNRSPESLRKNIVLRGRSYEQNIKDEYLTDIQRIYLNWVSQNPIDSCWTIEADRYDFLKNQSDLDRLIERIDHLKKD